MPHGRDPSRLHRTRIRRPRRCSDTDRPARAALERIARQGTHHVGGAASEPTRGAQWASELRETAYQDLPDEGARRNPPPSAEKPLGSVKLIGSLKTYA